MSTAQAPRPAYATQHGTDLPPPTHRIKVVATEKDLAEEFVKILSGGTKNPTQVTDHKRRINLEVNKASPTPDVENQAADGLLLLVRHLDDRSFKEAQSVIAGLPEGIETALVIATIRESGQSQFKMSCTCGQKLYVSDSEVGKQGRCPACGRRFTLPTEAELVQAHLTMERPAPVVHIIRGLRSLHQEALTTLLDKIDEHSAASKRQTMRIQIPDEAPNTVA